MGRPTLYGIYVDPDTGEEKKIPIKVDEDGNLKGTQVGSNESLLDAESFTWDGVLTEHNTSDINIPSGREILVRIDNQADQTLVVTFQHKVGTEYVDYKGADGNLLSFEINSNTHEIFGLIQGFPRFDAGRITVSAESAPSNNDTTIIEVREV